MAISLWRIENIRHKSDKYPLSEVGNQSLADCTVRNTVSELPTAAPAHHFAKYGTTASELAAIVVAGYGYWRHGKHVYVVSAYDTDTWTTYPALEPTP